MPAVDVEVIFASRSTSSPGLPVSLMPTVDVEVIFASRTTSSLGLPVGHPRREIVRPRPSLIRVSISANALESRIA
jgi:hypothetical protein